MPAYVYDMFYVGECPWHKLGTQLDIPPNTDEALKLAGLNWPVYKERMNFNVNGNVIPTNYFATYRVDSDNNPIILGNVSAKYEVLQNIDAFKPFDKVLLDYGYVYETAGSVQGGKKVWVLAKAPSSSVVSQLSDGKDDVVDKYVLLFNGHDGKQGVVLKPTQIRVVCYNTLMLALNLSDKNEIILKHTTGVNEKLDTVVTMLKLAEGRLDIASETFKRMAEIEISQKEAITYFETVSPKLKNRDSVEYTNYGRKIPNHQVKIFSSLMDNFYHGAGNHGKTLWDAYNSVTEYVDHNKQYKDWIKTAFFGSGGELKKNAFLAAKNIVENKSSAMIVN